MVVEIKTLGLSRQGADKACPAVLLLITVHGISFYVWWTVVQVYFQKSDRQH